MIVYVLAFLQFAPFVRNKNILLHRILGRVYIVVALVNIASLFCMITMGKNAGLPFWPSQYSATSFWLMSIVLALYFARQGMIKWHRRFMISGFICAAYFVTVRIVDRFGMGVFEAVIPNKGIALLVSDFFIWVLPLLIVWCFWLFRDRRLYKA